MAFMKKFFQGNGLINDEEDQGLAAADEREIETADDDQIDGQLAVDVFQDGDNVVIKSTIAGVKPEDLDITIANDLVTIKGERREEREETDRDYFFQECYWGAFSRSLTLPVEVDVDKAVADLKDGILTLTLPKASRAKAKKVKIRSEE